MNIPDIRRLAGSIESCLDTNPQNLLDDQNTGQLWEPWGITAEFMDTAPGVREVRRKLHNDGYGRWEVTDRKVFIRAAMVRSLVHKGLSPESAEEYMLLLETLDLTEGR